MLIALFIISFDLGIGVNLGDPTGIGGKLWSKNHAFETSVAWSLPGDYFLFTFDWNVFVHKTSEENFSAQFYPGIGGFLGVWDRGATVGPKVPLGVDFFIAKTPLNLSLEISPAVSIIPDTSFKLFGFIAVRYVFQGVQKSF